MKFGVKKLITILIVALSTICLSMAGIMMVRNINKSNNSKPQLAVSAWSGSGTEDDPIKISSIADMNKLSSDIASGNNYYGVYFELTSDLDYSSVSNFVPIGATASSTTITGYNSFCGIFDGAGHIVSNLTSTFWSNSSGYNAYIGFFAALGAYDAPQYDGEMPYNSSYVAYSIRRQATVKNLKIQNFKVNSYISGSSIGGIAGLSITRDGEFVANSPGSVGGTYANKTVYDYTYGVSIEQCIVEGLSVNSESSILYASGLVGENRTFEGNSPLTIKNCMVMDFSFNASTQSIVTAIGPSYASYGQYSEFMYCYDISYCVTDVTQYFTVNGVDPCLAVNFTHNSAPHSKYGRPNDIYGKESTNALYNTVNMAKYGLNGLSGWFCDKYTYFVYLNKFLTKLTSLTCSEGGTVLVNDNNHDYTFDEWTGYENIYIPRKQKVNTTNSVINSNKANKEGADFTELECGCAKYDSEVYYYYNFKAVPNEGYEFDHWNVSETSSGVTYHAVFKRITPAYLTITFLERSGTDKTTRTTYTIAYEGKVTITLSTTMLKPGAYTTCRFSFTSYDNKAIVETYNLLSTNITQYIKGWLDGSSLSTSSTTLTITENKTFSVELATKEYSSNFG